MENNDDICEDIVRILQNLKMTHNEGFSFVVRYLVVVKELVGCLS